MLNIKLNIVVSASLMAGSLIGVTEALSILIGASAGEYDALFWGVIGYSVLCIFISPLSFALALLIPIHREALWLSVFLGLSTLLGIWVFSLSWVQSLWILCLGIVGFWFGRIILMRTPLKTLLRLKGGLGFFTLIVLIVGVFSLTPGRNIYAPPAHVLSGQGKPNIVILLVDGLRTDYLRAGLSPAIDSFAQSSVRFESAFANSPEAFHSVAQLVSGGSSQDTHFLSEEVVSLAEHFAYHGYQTFALVNQQKLGRFSNLHQGFDRYRYLPPRSSLPLNEGTRRLKLFQTVLSYQAQMLIDPNRMYRSAGDVLFQFQQEVKRNPQQTPWLAMLQISELTPPLFVQHFNGEYTDVIFPEAANQQVSQRAYVDNLRKVDWELSHFFRYLEQSGLRENTIVVLTASHATSLSPREAQQHIELQVPLFISSPKIAPKEIRQDVQLSELPKTLSVLASIPSESSWGGDMIFRLPPREHLRSIRASFRDREQEWELLQHGEWRYIEHKNRVDELYHLAQDPFLEVNLIHENPEQKNKMRSVLERDQQKRARTNQGAFQ